MFVTTASCRAFQFVFNYGARLLPWRKAVPEMGAGAVSRLPCLLRLERAQKPLIVTDRGVVRAGVAAKAIAALEAAGVPYAVFDEVEPNPTVDTVNAAAARYRAEGCSAFVPIGGGSPIDAAKAAAALIAFPHKTVTQLGGLLRVWKRVPPVIAVPTTAGTGSETTIAALVTDPATHRKFAIMDLHLSPAAPCSTPRCLPASRPRLPL